MRYIRINTSIEVGGRWFLEGHTFEVIDQSLRLVECFGCGVTPRQYSEIHYHVRIDNVTYHIPGHSCAHFIDNTINDVPGPQKTPGEEWADKVMKDPIIDEYGGDYMKAYEALTGINIRVREGASQATMPHPNALEELMERKIKEGKYTRGSNPGNPSDSNPG